MKKDSVLHRIKRRFIKLRLQPIRVFCFHQVSDSFDEGYMERIDWMQTGTFMQRIESLQGEGYKFISLIEAQEKLKRDYVCFAKFHSKGIVKGIIEYIYRSMYYSNGYWHWLLMSYKRIKR